MAQFQYDYNPAKTEDFRASGISGEKLNLWSQNHLFRTSYGNHWTNRPQEPKNVAYPGYGGFIPGKDSENKYGKGYSAVTRECFADPKLGENKFKLSSTGFNFRKTDFIDHSINASSHKYGNSTIQKHHPCLHPAQWQTQTQFSHRNPKQLVNPTFRETEKNLETQKEFTKTSGFTLNHTQFDGRGWLPDQVLHGDRSKTEYRNRYNKGVDFHRDPVQFKVRKLPHKESNYKYI